MPRVKYQPEAFSSQDGLARLPNEEPASARLAGDRDPFVASPVHRLQSDLSAFVGAGEQPVVERYSGWFRLGFPVAASSLLWIVILRLTGLVG
jgi:hypothetical protein